MSRGCLHFSLGASAAAAAALAKLPKASTKVPRGSFPFSKRQNSLIQAKLGLGALEHLE